MSLQQVGRNEFNSGIRPPSPGLRRKGKAAELKRAAGFSRGRWILICGGRRPPLQESCLGRTAEGGYGSMP